MDGRERQSEWDSGDQMETQRIGRGHRCELSAELPSLGKGSSHLHGPSAFLNRRSSLPALASYTSTYPIDRLRLPAPVCFHQRASINHSRLPVPIHGSLLAPDAGNHMHSPE